jgi:hypothetical protein
VPAPVPLENRVGELNRRVGDMGQMLENMPHVIASEVSRHVQAALAQRQQAPPPPRGFQPPQQRFQQPPPPAGSAFGGNLDPELEELYGRFNERVGQTDQRVDRLLQLMEAQNVERETARGQQIVADMSKDFPCFADPDLGPDLVAKFAQERRARPWVNPGSIAQSLQERHDRLITRLSANAVRPPSAVSPGAAVVPGSGPSAPVIANTAPVGAREAGRLVSEALRQPVQ